MCLYLLTNQGQIVHDYQFPVISNLGGSMFTSTDLSIIHNPYFTILRIDETHCEIQSNNTHHIWMITESRDGFYHLFHRHTAQDPYHDHAAYISAEDCLLDIASHDEFQLRHRKPSKYPPHDTFFDEILRTYSLNNACYFPESTG